MHHKTVLAICESAHNFFNTVVWAVAACCNSLDAMLIWKLLMPSFIDNNTWWETYVMDSHIFFFIAFNSNSNNYRSIQPDKFLQSWSNFLRTRKFRLFFCMVHFLLRSTSIFVFFWNTFVSIETSSDVVDVTKNSLQWPKLTKPVCLTMFNACILNN